MPKPLTAVLAEAYGLSHVTLRQIQDGPRLIHRVDADSGRYVVKSYRPEDGRLDALARSDAGNARAMARGLPTPPIMPNRDGRRATDGGDLHHVLYRHVEGHHHSATTFTPRAAAHLGAAIGRLEQAFADFDPGDLPPDHPWPKDTDEAIARLTATLRAAEAGTDPASRKTASALRSRIDALEGLADELRAVADLPLQWVHGDCNPDNVLFTADDAVAAILDFDNLSRLPRGFDFMYALNQSFRAPDACARSALHAYLDLARPTRAEVATHPIMWMYCDMQIVWHTTHTWTHPYTRQHHEGQVATPAPPWWLAHWREMTEFFLATYDAWVDGRLHHDVFWRGEHAKGAR